MKKEENKERPLECSACTRELTYKYSEVADEVIQCFYMCSKCPALEEFKVNKEIHHPSTSSNIICGHCNTSLIHLQHGESLGCRDCYETFEPFILKELKEYIPNLAKQELPPLLHQGHKPGELKEINPSLKILTLNEALTKTLNEENYEQAAWIRDQIQELKMKLKHS